MLLELYSINDRILKLESGISIVETAEGVDVNHFILYNFFIESVGPRMRNLAHEAESVVSRWGDRRCFVIVRY